MIDEIKSFLSKCVDMKDLGPTDVILNIKKGKGQLNYSQIIGSLMYLEKQVDCTLYCMEGWHKALIE
ncbi:hypothetical protein ACJX0J_007235, partial [Zea mays]